MPKQYTISQLAKAADIPTTTVRYYERIGLLAPDDRSQGNYRLYSDESLSRVKFIRAAQATGFKLDDIKTLVGVRDGSSLSCREVQSMIESRLADVEKQLKDLRRVKRVLNSALTRCHESDPAGSCQVIETLQRKT